MKKQIVALTALAGLSIGIAGQASAASIHTVEKGDTLWAISQENNVSVQDIQDWNNLNSTIIYPNQQLNIEESKKTYVVVTGDTLYSIAQKHGLTVNKIMTTNQLTSDVIHEGDLIDVSGGMVKAVSNNAEESNPIESNPSVGVKELSVTATAYTASCKGCSGVTATGIDLIANPNKKVISVDPSVIPLGTKVWVEGYGNAVAGDTGGAIKGNKIDVFIPSYEEAMNWGRKTVKVKILD